MGEDGNEEFFSQDSSQEKMDNNGWQEHQEEPHQISEDSLTNDTDDTLTDDDLQTPIRRRRVQREFPAAPFEEALEVALAIQEQASGQKIRRLRLFELMGRSAESSASRQILTNSSRYGLTNGSYKAEWIELTQDGYIATADDVPEREKTRARFKLAIEQITPFKKLHERYMNNRLPAKGVMADFLKEEGMSQDAVSESIDTFLLNAKFVGVLQNIAGAERLVALEYVLDQTPATTPSNPPASPRVLPILENSTNEGGTLDTTATSSQSLGISGEAWSRTCFYITPIGPEGSEQRMHSNLFLGQIVEPALEEFNLDVVRGDRIKEAGMITRQEIQYVMNARLVVADLSFHNPNVFYELALRHVSGLPTVQLIRASESVPFDIGQMRTVRIDTTSIYTLVPQLEVYRAEIANQVRRALENSEVADNPFTAFYSAKIVSR